MKRVITSILKKCKYYNLAEEAKHYLLEDRKGLINSDPGIKKVIKLAIEWIGLAQDCSASKDGGVARHYSLISGWGTSYPETTGYIVPTMLEYAKLSGDKDSRHRAKRMLDWLVSIQFPEGGFQGGTIDAKPLVPVTFNTGQILLGLARGIHEFGDIYREAMQRAANWLISIQDTDGCWRKYSTPFAVHGEKAYDTHVAYGLMEAARIEPDKPYGNAAIKNVRWALTQQQENGWVKQCCLIDNSKPLTHTLGYMLRGILEAYKFSREDIFLEASKKMADGLLVAMKKDGFLPGRLYPNWQGAVNWACLTGTSQVALCWLLLHQFTNEQKYLEAACTANRYVRRTVNIDAPPQIRGAVKGSFPIDGDYGKYEYINWACKFTVDANILEQLIRNKIAI